MSKNIFNSIQLKRPKSNVFDLTHDVKLSLNMGELVPIACFECVPGDKFKIGCESLLRFMPLISPVMHRFNVSMHYFFVPNRITWDGWEDWISPTAPSGVSTRSFPTITYSEDGNDAALGRYLGLPNLPIFDDRKLSALPLAAYQMIYNEYYRDQNLIDPVNFKLVDGVNDLNTDLYILRKRAWQHDYFTSSLPWAQKGPSVDIPLGEVTLAEDWFAEEKFPTFRDGNDVYRSGDLIQAAAPEQINATPNAQQLAYDPNGSLEVQPTTINELRRSFRLQEWLEKNARAGTRYVESILAHFGVKSSDARLNRPEYIYGTKSPVMVSEVLNTAGQNTLDPDDPGLPQGNMAGHAVSITSGNTGSYRCEEHGYIIGIMSVLPNTAYQQGVPKHWLKFENKFQYFWPEFANIGEQPVVNQEVYADLPAGTEPNQRDGTFGYVPRFAEYKFEQNRVAGEMRTTLNFWHAGRIFDTQPQLNKAFVEANPTTRIFAVEGFPGDQKLIAHVLNKVTAVRLMPKFGTPTF
ncbi:major capsid protein [Blackfly microvirus SF02]|uniref:Major capsid protein n=1 Tax=Blackfly microvirus SF02 TaxID=2576452 RepID=A0A4P8PLY8_9VIRU|nr:major capsid protein [Blackfly microvirus SF02]